MVLQILIEKTEQENNFEFSGFNSTINIDKGEYTIGLYMYNNKQKKKGL